MTIIVHPVKSNSFLCIKSIHHRFTEGQLYNRDQIMRELMRLIKSGTWIISEVTHHAIWWTLKLTNNTITILFIPIICPNCSDKFDDIVPIQKSFDLPETLICRRCETFWKEEVFSLIQGSIKPKKMSEFI
jgi:hypothetical protein